MTTSNTTAAGTSQDSAIRAVFAQTSRAWADGDGEAFAAWYAPDATVILPGVCLPGQDAIREAMAAAFAGPLKNTRRSHQVRSIRFTSPGTAIVITDSVTVPPGRTSASGSAARTSDLGAVPERRPMAHPRLPQLSRRRGRPVAAPRNPRNQHATLISTRRSTT
jgi:uncharacterized protein (TIGR02246 family)